jgi:hypothetical protein
MYFQLELSYFVSLSAVFISDTLYMLKPHHQNAGHDHNMKIANRSSENVATLK